MGVNYGVEPQEMCAQCERLLSCVGEISGRVLYFFGCIAARRLGACHTYIHTYIQTYIY